MDYIVDTVKTDDFEMPYLKFGEGQKNMIIIPGISLRPLTISPTSIVEAFSDFTSDYTVYLFDRKKNKQKPYYVENMADDTLKAIKTLGIKDLYAYGASQGGQILMYMNIKYPKLFKKNVWASTCFYINGSCLDLFDKLNEYVEERNPRSLVSYMTRAIYSKDFCNNYLDSLVNAYRDLSIEEMDEFATIIDKNDRIYLLDDLDKVKAKTMIVASKQDTVYGYEPSLHMTLKMNCDCVIYDEYSHAVYDEAPDFRERMKKFFAS